jgi:hypothetical protein
MLECVIITEGTTVLVYVHQAILIASAARSRGSGTLRIVEYAFELFIRPQALSDEVRSSLLKQMGPCPKEEAQAVSVRL